MSDRLTRIYTRTGDHGTTHGKAGIRVSKDSIRIETYGNLDELNSFIGLVLSEPVADEVRTILAECQHRLFDLGGELFSQDSGGFSEEDVHALEKRLDNLNKELPPLKEFVLPGGNRAAAACHVARAVCRRCERSVVSLARDHEINPLTIQYLNRLSDLLFVIARVLARADGGQETCWAPRR